MINQTLLQKMTPAMKTVYTDFYGNMERLKSEWKLCNTQYNEAVALAMGKDADLSSRQEIRKISDYWIRRKQALERTLPKDVIESFKK